MPASSKLSQSELPVVSYGLDFVRHPLVHAGKPSAPIPRGPVNQFGFPRPGEQSPSSDSATSRYYFADEAKWQEILDHGRFDDIVCGTGFCALAYIDKALALDPYRSILVLERGGFWLPTHFQNLPLPFKLLLSNSSETYPWTLTSRTFNDDLRFIHGLFPFFGGRSPFWSSWSPRPPLALLRDFPESLKKTASDEFWSDCKKLLDIVHPSDLLNEEYRVLQPYIENQFKYAGVKTKADFKAAEEKKVEGTAVEREGEEIPTADYGEPADLAVGRTTRISKKAFEKFSTPGPLLKIFDRQRELAKEGKGSPLTIATRTTVERLEIDPHDKRVTVLQTSRGALCFPGDKKTNIILATGAIPACTIVLNSVHEQSSRAGSRLTGHFLTQIIARFPVPSSFKSECEEENDALRIAAYYLAGRAPSGLQYHADITVIHSPHPEEQEEDVIRLCPDYFAAPNKAQMKDSKESVIVACVMLGEIDENNAYCHITSTNDRINPDPTTNIHAQVMMSEKEQELRKVIHEATRQAIEVMADERQEIVHEAIEKAIKVILGNETKNEKREEIRKVVEKAMLQAFKDAASNPRAATEEVIKVLLSNEDKDEKEEKLRKVVETAISAFITKPTKNEKIEYWHASDEGDGTGEWKKTLPNDIEFQMTGIVHESSTLYMDDALPTDPKLEDPEKDAKSKASVDKNYRVYGTSNVYVTGSAIFPTAGSWNPTRMMCGFARDLAKKLCRPDVFQQVFSLSLASHIVNERKKSGERIKPREAIQGVLPKIGMEWELLWGPALSNEGSTTLWYIVHHPSLEFEDESVHPTYVIAISDIPSFVEHNGWLPKHTADFGAWVKGGEFQAPPKKVEKVEVDDKPYVNFGTAQAAHTVLTTKGSKLAGTENTLDFILKHRSRSARFIVAGHSIGGAVASAVALALESAGVSANKIFAYPTAAPSPGNKHFNNLFSTKFPARRADVAGDYKGWNLNLVNIYDVVPKAWCTCSHDHTGQNLENIPIMYGGPAPKKVLAACLAGRILSESSGVAYMPFPSQTFSGIRDNPPAPDVDPCAPLTDDKRLHDFLLTAGEQHIQAYVKKIWDYPASEKMEVLNTGLTGDTEKLNFDFPLADYIRLDVGTYDGLAILRRVDLLDEADVKRLHELLEQYGVRL